MIPTCKPAAPLDVRPGKGASIPLQHVPVGCKPLSEWIDPISGRGAVVVHGIPIWLRTIDRAGSDQLDGELVRAVEQPLFDSMAMADSSGSQSQVIGSHSPPVMGDGVAEGVRRSLAQLARKRQLLKLD
jgi:hypothetical protein